MSIEALSILKRQAEGLKDQDAELRGKVDDGKDKVKAVMLELYAKESELAQARSEVFSAKQMLSRNNQMLGRIVREIRKLSR